MSRSYKKTPSSHFIKPDKGMKKLYNRKLRRCKEYEDLPDGKSYRKANESWDIEEWHEVNISYNEFKRQQQMFDNFEDDKQCRKDYEKLYLRK